MWLSLQWVSGWLGIMWQPCSRLPGLCHYDSSNRIGFLYLTTALKQLGSSYDIPQAHRYARGFKDDGVTAAGRSGMVMERGPVSGDAFVTCNTHIHLGFHATTSRVRVGTRRTGKDWEKAVFCAREEDEEWRADRSQQTRNRVGPRLHAKGCDHAWFANSSEIST
ncbi:hypothetical protein BKA62DRAFT_700189 [Auriculariales sp. MPI-PUGE-AT-0066]|nr:hypothetical protein BKA62DRAFT_700189 [Auriculariales sp. MPI-PUGE-AT-0066]